MSLDPLPPELYLVAAVIAACFLAALAAIVWKLIAGEQASSANDAPEGATRVLERPSLTVDPNALPPALRELAPLAQRWGIADDLLRHQCLEAATPGERAALLAAVARHQPALTEWLKVTNVTQSPDWIAVASMETAAAEMKELLIPDR